MTRTPGLAGVDGPGVAGTVVSDQAAFRALTRAEAAGWGRVAPSPAVLAADWERLRADVASSAAFALLATMEGTPALVGRCRGFGSVIRLFGAVTLPSFRRQGLYCSVLAARCRLGRAQGATLALTKARFDTSAPVLERVGFRSHGAERCWRLPVDG
ncbi:MAG: GNAT family N-acetyltransferase [Acidimicrobiales bacterium]